MPTFKVFKKFILRRVTTLITGPIVGALAKNSTGIIAGLVTEDITTLIVGAFLTHLYRLQEPHVVTTMASNLPQGLLRKRLNLTILPRKHHI